MAWAIITGGSAGIGLCISKELCKRGYDALIVSRNINKLSAARDELTSLFPEREVRTMSLDLSLADSPRKVYDYALNEGLDVDVIVNDADIYYFQDVIDIPAEKVDTIIHLNVSALVHLTRLFGLHFAEKGHGYIMNISSYSVYMRFPALSIYSATKAFVKNFSMGFADEVRDRGVVVTTIAPSAVKTTLLGFSDKAVRIAMATGMMLSPETIARKSVRALFRKKRYYIPGWYNHLFIPLLLKVGRRGRGLAKKLFEETDSSVR